MSGPGPKLDLKNPVYELMEQELIDLNQEIANHPDLMARLALQTDKDVYIMINEIAAHLGILLNGGYDKDAILKLCTLMTEKLIEKRTIQIFQALPQ